MLKPKGVVPQILETGCKPVLLLCKFTSFCLIFFIAYYHCFLFLFSVYLHLCLSVFIYRAFLTSHFHLFDQWWAAVSCSAVPYCAGGVKIRFWLMGKLGRAWVVHAVVHGVVRGVVLILNRQGRLKLRFITEISRMNRFYDRFDGPKWIDFSEADYLSNNDDFWWVFLDRCNRLRLHDTAADDQWPTVSCDSTHLSLSVTVCREMKWESHEINHESYYLSGLDRMTGVPISSCTHSHSNCCVHVIYWICN